MTRSEIALLLGAIAGRDQRTIGDADVLAWHEDLGDLDFADARAAVSRHFRESTDRIMPAHIRRLTRIIRDERRASTTVRALPPGKLEDDPDRDARIARNRNRVREILAEYVVARSVPGADEPPLTGSDLIRQRALDRSRAEKRSSRREAA
ncbi:hypothetical protein AMIS_2660 [Actinoplanes missouriensis 431]|uniref:Uncharacterized protein n=1 Tax=Actinoplanes missouriensis (strain ATCC 14538 / DSM 43046 / CBS 188.64 / JCM 3121 / NBRC 102363 / NCIMB 12654 / NRRL B-3342 / UNCC 431) TaxID=512565 RepID=I0GXJ9_ACTM4|nr:hypothetical protein [Actinoplanes missouriensis]BAL85486.1 hypothetical protein AMIS_2660 [Actinoplanes missouriensis 431]